MAMSATCSLFDVFRGAQCFHNGGYSQQQWRQRKPETKQHSISAGLQLNDVSSRIGQKRFLAGSVSLEGVGRPRSGPLLLKKRSAIAASGPDQTSSPTQVIEPELTVPSTAPPSTQPVPPENGSPNSVPPDNFPAWARTVDECAEHFCVDLKRGLTTGQVETYRSAYGWNELEKEPGTPFWQLVAEQFDDALVKILLGAAGVSGALAVWDAAEAGEPVGAEDFLETFVILLIIVLNAVIGVWQESKAESTLAALKEMQSETARVVRDGKEIPDLPARELVPGDLVELRVGDKAPADIRLVELRSATLRAQQSSLTGESQPVSKDTHVVPQEDIELQGKECMVFAGSGISNGTAIGVVVHTGMRTEIGKIQAQIQQASQEGYDTPLTRKLDDFADLLTKVVGAVCVLVWVINYKYFLSFDPAAPFPSNIQFDFQQCAYYFKVAVALAVAAIPEGLPAVITTCLALGTKRMAEENAIVRRLPSVETLGCTSVICSDKTGTLTTNQMSVVRLVSVGFTPGELREFVVEGTTYNPADGGVVGLPIEGGGLDKSLEAIAEISAVCNDAGLAYKKGAYGATGMPTEAALKVLVEKLGVPDKDRTQALREARAADAENAALGACQDYKDGTARLATLEFDRNRKSMSVVCTSSALFGLGGNRLLVKGAAECVLARCSKVLLSSGLTVPLGDDVRPQILAAVDRITSRGLRCLAFGVKTNLGDLSSYDGSEDHPGQALLRDSENYADVESDLTFVGLAGLQDPPRKEVLPALAECKKAGIRVIVITGDNKNTAEAICREIGLFTPDQELASKSMTGGDFMRLPEGAKRGVLLEGLKSGSGLVFSRAEPVHKQEIVRLLKAGGHVVAMTGDGVNDAPALKSADIGIAMGISGTEVAKEASDMILADDDFATIVSAVREGRSIYDNMKAFIRYLISSNIGEVVSIFLAAALGLPQGLIPVQLLWVNLVTDGAPATALGFNPPEEGIMERAPRSRDEGLVSGWLFVRYSVIGAYVGIATVAAFGIWYLFPSFLGIDLSGDGHTVLTWQQLSSWGTCSTWPDFHPAPYTAGALTIAMDNPCDYFTTGKVKASTLAMSTLVLIEMFNALNALSENNSLVTTKPWVNKWLLLAISVSLGLHFVILSVPFLQEAFGVVPLSTNEWLLVIALSAPIVAVDEVLKFVGRRWFTKPGSKQ